MVPDSCWYSNLRSILSAKQWNYIKQDARKRADGKCMICGRKTERLEAHEQWEYDEKTHTQILKDVVAVCHDCHSVIHIGRTQLLGNAEKAENHYIKVNGCSYADMRKDLGKANEDHQRRNLIPEWKLDLTWLKRFTKD